MRNFYQLSLITIAATLAFTSCQNNSKKEQNAIVTINKESLSLELSQESNLVATTIPADLKVDWKSTNPEIASVDQNGMVSGNNEGHCYVVAQSGVATDTCLVMVSTPIYTTEIEASKGINPWAGNGSKENPFIIATASQLRWMKEYCTTTNDSDGKYYKLLINIDLTCRTWQAITDFGGHFDGNNRTITGTMNAPTNLTEKYGFIGSMVGNSSISNLIVEADINCANVNSTGGIVGQASSSNYGGMTPVIASCTFDGTITSKANVGGIMGVFNIALDTKNEHTPITGCKNLGTVIGSSYSLGGIVGILSEGTSQSSGKSITIENCNNDGFVEGSYSSNSVGEIIGTCAVGSSSLTIKECSATGFASIEDDIATENIGNANNYLGKYIGKNHYNTPITIE